MTQRRRGRVPGSPPTRSDAPAFEVDPSVTDGDARDLTVGPLIVDAKDARRAAKEAAKEAASSASGLPESDLGRTPPALRETLEEVMAALRQAVPGMVEKWINGWKVFTLKSPPPKPRMFGYVSVLVDRVRIGIPAGVPGAEELFEAVKDRRFLQRDVRSAREVRVKGFAELMQRAARFEPPKKGRKA